MARYKRVAKKKEKKGISILESTETAKDWIANNFSKVSLIVGGIILTGAIGYGFVYYKKATYKDAQARLYDATVVTRAASMGIGDAKVAISKAREIIELGGPNEVVAQERLALAGLLFETGEFQEAAMEFTTSAVMMPEGSLHYERAMIGKARCDMAAGQFSEAERQFRALSKSVKYYPKADILLNLAFTLASAGKTDEAVETLNQIKVENPSFYSDDFIASTIRSIEDGSFVTSIVKTAMVLEKAETAQPVVKVHGEESK